MVVSGTLWVLYRKGYRIPAKLMNPILQRMPAKLASPLVRFRQEEVAVDAAGATAPT